MSATELALLFGGLGLGTIAAAIVAALATKRKVSAEATKLITDAASGVVQRMESELLRKTGDFQRELDEIRQAFEDAKTAWRAEREDWRRVNQEHVAFDVLAIAKLHEVGVDLGMEPPPLLPAIRADLS